MPLLGGTDGSYGSLPPGAGLTPGSGPGGGAAGLLGMVDPKTAALLGMAAGFGGASGATRLPTSLGQTFGAGAEGLLGGQKAALQQRLLGGQISLQDQEILQKSLMSKRLQQQIDIAQGMQDWFGGSTAGGGNAGAGASTAAPGSSSGAPGYVDRLIQIEDPSGDPKAKNPNSSATGLGQILTKGTPEKPSTWDYIYNTYLKDQGYPNDPTNPAASRAAIEAYARENGQKLGPLIGGAPSNGLLYTAHFLGAGGAMRMLAAPPDQSAADFADPLQVSKNHAMFFKGDHALTVAEFRAKQEDRFAGTQPLFGAPPQQPGQQPSQGGGTQPGLTLPDGSNSRGTSPQTQQTLSAMGYASPQEQDVIREAARRNPMLGQALIETSFGNAGAARTFQTMVGADPGIQRALTFAREGRNPDGSMNPTYAQGTRDLEFAKTSGGKQADLTYAGPIAEATARGTAGYDPLETYGPGGATFMTTRRAFSDRLANGATPATAPAPGNPIVNGGPMGPSGLPSPVGTGPRPGNLGTPTPVAPGAAPAAEIPPGKPTPASVAPPILATPAPVVINGQRKDISQVSLDDLFPGGAGITQPPTPPAGSTYGKPSAQMVELQKQDAETVGKWQTESDANQKIYQDLGHIRGTLFAAAQAQKDPLNTNKLAPFVSDLTNIAHAYGLDNLIPKGADPNDYAVFQKASTDLVFEAVKKLAGQVKVAEIEGYKQANPNATLPPEANMSIINDVFAAGKWQDQRATLGRQFLQQNPGASLKDFATAYNSKVPLENLTQETRNQMRASGFKFPEDVQQSGAANKGAFDPRLITQENITHTAKNKGIPEEQVKATLRSRGFTVP